MTRYTFTILEEHRAALHSLLFRDDKESGALLLCGRSSHSDPWTGEAEERALVQRIVPVEDKYFLARSAVSLTWSTTPLFHLAKLAERKNLAITIAHSHQVDSGAFSPADDVADREAFQIVFNRVTSERPHFSMVMTRNGELSVRAYGADLKPSAVALVRIVGDRFALRYPDRGTAARALNAFDRQVRAFGRAALEDLRQLRVGIVGCGGTGSAVAMLLARLGITKVVLVDDDRVEETNLNRLHLATRTDAILRRHKVDVLAEDLARMGLVETVVPVRGTCESVVARDSLRACDIIFGCTDDHLGRNFLNRLAHFYLIPIIDLGLLIDPNDKGGYDTFDGRVTVVQPGLACQICRKLIDPNRMREEGLRRNDPAIFAQQRRAGYVRDAPEPSPAVVTFTTEVATMAVNELLQRLTGFRGAKGQCSERVRRFDEIKDSDTVPGGAKDPSCPLCGRRKYDGRGDMTPFLDMS